MKILILANSDLGLYKFRKELLERFLAEGHQVYVSLPDGVFVPDMERMGCIYLNTPISRHGTNPVEDMKLYSHYKKLLKHIKPNIVFTYTIKPNIYGGMACAAAKIPYVENITGLGSAVEKKGPLQLLTLSLYRLALRKVQTTFFQNTDNEQFFNAHGLAKGKHKMLPGSGVNLSAYQITDYPSDDQINFVFVGRVMREKGVEEYFYAAEQIHKQYPNTLFHICGPYEEAYEQRIKDLENTGVLKYHGLVKDMAAVYEKMHCTIHPTFYPEGMSNVLLETCACGRPIITTDRAGCREIVENGINGYMIPQQDKEALVSAVQKFLELSNDQKRDMGIAARRKVEKEFDRQIVVQKYLNEISAVDIS